MRNCCLNLEESYKEGSFFHFCKKSMMVGFVRREPHKHDQLRSDPQALEIFSRMRWLNFFFKLDGYDDRMALKFFE